MPSRGRLQHVEAFDDEHVRALHFDLLTGHDVIREVRVDVRGDLWRSALDLTHETQQRAAVV